MDNCEKIRDLLEAYADGELTEKQKAFVEQHVAHCPHCAALLDEYLTLNAAIADCAVQAPEGFTERVMAAVKAEQAAPVKPQGRGVRLGKIAPFVGIGVAAMLCLSIASSSLVKFVTKHFADPDISVETSEGGLYDPEPPADSLQEESPAPESPTLPETEQAGGSYDNAADPEEPTYEEPTCEVPTHEETAMDSVEYATTTPNADNSEDEQEGIPEQPTEAVTQPEIQEPVTTVAPETAQPETEGVAKPEVEGVTTPETEEQPAPEEQEPMTDAVTEQAESRGFFAKVWQAIISFFEKLWQAISRLFGGEA
ncbi:MAG: zf-HC2 domain-containing protein [Clostridia bacterium]|nr:zf-HC2 domain-containing protein [Clostridia bacterium]